MRWKWYNVEIDGGAYVDLNEYVRDYSEDIIKLFTDDTDEELKEEIQKRNCQNLKCHIVSMMLSS